MGQQENAQKRADARLHIGHKEIQRQKRFGSARRPTPLRIRCRHALLLDATLKPAEQGLVPDAWRTAVRSAWVGQQPEFAPYCPCRRARFMGYGGDHGFA
jgi:hypothetical protein